MEARHFVASRSELTGAGFSPALIDNWLRTARLIKVAHNVYVYGRDVESRLSAYRAALLAAGPGSVLTGRSACEHLQLVRTSPDLPSLIEVAVNPKNPRRLRGRSPRFRNTTIKIVSRDFRPEEICVKDGLNLTRPPLALIHFAVDANPKAVRFAFLEACRLGLFLKKDLKYTFGRMRGRRGARKLRPHLALWVPELERVRSILEGWFILTWAEFGYPMPLVNENVFGYEVDFYWPDQRVILELDGDTFHRDPPQKEIDARKQMHLEQSGMEVIRVTYGMFEANPYRLATSLAKHLGFK